MSQMKPLGEDRDTFMQRVRDALGRAQTEAPAEPAPEVDEAVVRLASSDDDLITMFADRAEVVGMHVHRVRQSDAAAKVCELLREAQAHCVGIAAGATGEQIGLEPSVREAGLEIADWRSGPGMSGQYELDAGITDVHAALAETGTLIVCSGPRHARGLSLAPPTHIALVRSTDILPDMIDYWRRLQGIPHTELPSSQALITGPSKTADIEGELITGVHGPGRVEIVVINEQNART